MNYLFVLLICILFVLIESAPAKSNGKYKRRSNEGKYMPTNEGKYVHKKYPYVHVPDYRELGIYKHIHIPYDGGFGPYSGFNIPYIHDFRDGLGDFSSYSVSKYDQDHPFNNQIFDIPIPETTTTTTPKPRPTTTRTTTTRRPTKAYDDEGKWKVIRHEQEKNKMKYDFNYLTENGIYQEEQADTKKDKGTNAKGYYEYIGDDDKVYRVYYSSGDEGFIAMGDHIPTTPPVPIEIQKALEYVAAKKKKTETAQQKKN